MSSMRWVARFLPVLVLSSGPASAQIPTAPSTTLVQAPSYGINYAISQWRRLRQGGNFSFADYASFLIYNRDWPDESAMRIAAEKAMRPGESPATVLAFFAFDKPRSGNGWIRYAEALSADGRTAEAIAAAKEAWASPGLNSTDAAYLLARFGGNLTTADYDRRVDSLLFSKNPQDAAQLIPWTSTNRRASFTARVAMQNRDPNAETLFQTVAAQVSADGGLLMDRLRYLEDSNNDYAARLLAAQPHQFTSPPADPDRWYDMLLSLSTGAANDREWRVAFNIARQLDDAFPIGTDLTVQPYGVRDKYTSLAWLAGRTALDRLNNPAGGVAMFARYARGGKSLQVVSKGEYWAGRAALAAGNIAEANTYFQAAANYPDLFYGQLALERLGRSVPTPPELPQIAASDPTRAIFANDRLAQATRYIFYYGNAQEQLLFTRALADALKSNQQRILATEMARTLGRKELAVWVAREARNNGDLFYYRDGYPTLSANVALSSPWALTHGITRQESSFDRNALSFAGARGMMQLMPGTAADWARKLGIAYDGSRLYEPSYNVMIGSAYFHHLLNVWNGSVPLAVASYNAGIGNVDKWIRANGDPRTGQVDMIGWIEAIPFSETRGYVQRVIENTVVYDSIRGGSTEQSAMHVSRYLGKSRPG